jgi:hypothetical protein
MRIEAQPGGILSCAKKNRTRQLALVSRASTTEDEEPRGVPQQLGLMAPTEPAPL